MIWILTLFSVCASRSFYTEEISAIQKDLRTLAKARALLTQTDSEELLSLFPATESHWSTHRLVPKSVVSSDSQILSSCFITLKPMPGLIHGSNLGVIFVYSSGVLELREITGKLLYKLDLGYAPIALAGSNSFDDIRFAVLSKAKLEIFSVVIENPIKPVVVEDFGVQVANVFISIYRDAEVNLSDSGTALTLFIKGGKKYWAVGCENGQLHLVTFLGSVESTLDLGVGKITAFDRFGPQLILSTEKESGLVNIGSQQLTTLCSSGGTSISLDSTNTTSILHVSDGESIKTFDFRVVEKEKFSCKEIRKTGIKCQKIYSTKDFLACLDNGELKMVDLKQGTVLNKIPVDPSSINLIGFKTASTGFLLSIFGGTQGYIFEIIPGKSVSSDNFDIAIFRYILIAAIVIIVAYWQYTKAKKPSVSKEKKNN